MTFDSSFGKWFVGTILLFLAFLVLLRILALLIATFRRPPPFPTKFTRESTRWLDFILHHVIARLQNDEVREHINASSPQLKIRAAGAAPSIPYVGTLEMERADDVRLLIPIDWVDGPSLDLITPLGPVIEIDVNSVQCRVLISWPGDNPSVIEIRFDREYRIDCDVAVRFTPTLAFSLTGLPLIGRTVTQFAIAILAKQQFVLPIPRPQIPIE
jgi:hypothetical protein